MMMFKRILLVALVVLVAACSKSPPETVPVQLTVNLQVPSMRAPHWHGAPLYLQCLPWGG